MKWTQRVFSISAGSLLLFCSSPKNGSQTLNSAEYYSIADFGKVEKFDSHIHLNTLQPAFINQAKADNVKFLDIVDDRPFGIDMYAQERIALTQVASYPGWIKYATTFPTANFNSAAWENEVLTRLKTAIDNGAVAVKVWKNIGMALKDASGQFVMIDHPRFDTILNYLAEKKIPLIGHLGEPRECWLPLDSMLLNKGYYSKHPEYHMFLHPEYPSYEKQIAARDRMLEKHPHLQFIGAHLGSIEWSLDELAKRLDKYPNMAVDLARMTNLFLHAKNDYEKTRSFFTRYQDRLLYATDIQVAESDDTAALKKQAHESRLRLWKFFVSDEKLSDPIVGDFTGLKLPREIIDKIYRKNAQKWLGINFGTANTSALFSSFLLSGYRN